MTEPNITGLIVAVKNGALPSPRYNLNLIFSFSSSLYLGAIYALFLQKYRLSVSFNNIVAVFSPDIATPAIPAPGVVQ